MEEDPLPMADLILPSKEVSFAPNLATPEEVALPEPPEVDSPGVVAAREEVRVMVPEKSKISSDGPQMVAPSYIQSRLQYSDPGTPEGKTDAESSVIREVVDHRPVFQNVVKHPTIEKTESHLLRHESDITEIQRVTEEINLSQKTETTFEKRLDNQNSCSNLTSFR